MKINFQTQAKAKDSCYETKITTNAARFASLINKDKATSKKGTSKCLSPDLSNETFNNRAVINLNKIAGINLDQNRFAELANIDGRFWDSNSNANANVNGGMKSTSSKYTMPF